MQIRPLIEADVDAVVAAEARLHPTPWTEGQFRDSMAHGHGLWVGETAGELAAYAVTMQVLDEAHLLNISVLLPFQRRGSGTGMLHFVMAHAKGTGAMRMFLEVRASNQPAQALYARAGFIRIGCRKAYYALPETPDQREDAIVMAVDLAENASHG